MKNNIFIDNSILIVPNNIKNKILLKLNSEKEVYNIKIISLNEFINNITFSYDERAICYLVDKYKIKYDIALIYLNNIRYIKFKKYDSDKLNKLVKIKEELDKKDLLIYDELFSKLIKNKKIIVYGYNFIDKYSLKYLKKYNAEVIFEKNNNYNHTVYEFSLIDEEVEFVAEKIVELMHKGIDINKIKLCNVTSEYFFTISKIFTMYNLNIMMENLDSIYSTNIIKTFFKYINKNIDITLSILKERFDFTDTTNSYVFNSLIKVLNRYYFVEDYTSIREILTEELKKIKLKSKKYKNSIEIVNLKDNVFEDDEFVFLLGFNQTVLPKVYKDEEYISDKEKKLLDLETSLEKNIIEKQIIINSIKNIKNLIITYKLSTPFNSYFPTNLIEELNYEIIKNKSLTYLYSNKSNKLNLSKKLDKYIKYGEIDKDLNTLYTTYNDINYMSYNNKFKGIDKKSLYNVLNNKLTLSYTSMDTYYNCSFMYYLKNILKIEEYEETFAAFVGSLFHDILSKCFLDNFSFEDEFYSYIKNKEFTFKDKFYIEKLKQDLLFIIKTIKKQYVHMDFNKALYEEETIVNFDKNIEIKFKGYIDKLLYKEENENTYVVIIDYKTGSPELNLNNSIYGLNLQLPVYLYLTKNNKKLKNVKVLGFYLQKILNNSIRKTKNKTFKIQKEENLKLQGYSIDDINLLEKVDDTYENSEIIASLKTKKDGFYSYSKVINEKTIDQITKLTEEKIEEVIDSILDGKFDINPKKIGDDLYECTYCKFKDVCYRTNNDIVNLKKYNDLEFLR